MMTQHIFTFAPIYKSTVWGGEKIARFKGEHIDQHNIGESWEISAVPGHESVVASGPDKGLSLSELCAKYGAALLGTHKGDFPLLVKIIDAQSDLSVQVHPNDALARRRHNCPGKTEMWYVVSTEPGARIVCGFKKQLNPAEFNDVVARGEFQDYMASNESHPGDCFFIPAGRVHSIGAGNLLVEIQQSSDITYRIYDFNRRDANGNLRELHIEQAKDAIDYSVLPDGRTHYTPRANHPVELVDCPYFNTSELCLDAGAAETLPAIDSFRIIVVFSGSAEVTAANGEKVTLTRGHSALIAAEAGPLTIASPESSSMLICHV